MLCIYSVYLIILYIQCVSINTLHMYCVYKEKERKLFNIVCVYTHDWYFCIFGLYFVFVDIFLINHC